jgi:Flp pilus assembly protein TadG
MRITSGISTAALMAWMLVGLSSRAQEPVAPENTPAGDNASATDTASAQTSAPSHSKIRIVRLSEVKGEVQLDRQTGKGFEGAMANLPVVEGERLKTGNGVAEVEFEDNSTVRVAQNSLVEFPRLELLPSGAKASSINVVQGMVYVSLVNTKGNEFTVNVGQNKINLPPDTHIRLQLTADQANLAVLHGDAQVEQPSGPTTVGKDRTMSFSLAGQSQPVIAKNVTQDPLDAWDKDAVQYHKSFANASSFGNSPYSYGINDMNYYGSFSSGCGGSMWRPYFASANWNPYGSGAWAYYPSAGYSWVSPYPWGWTPYHYGSWAFCQGLGWGWQPGGQWMGLANNSFVSSPASGTGSHPLPHPPSRPPSAAEATLVPVNLKAMPASSLATGDKFVFRNDSAGLGVPRGSLGKLNSFSNQTAQHGMASTNVYYGGAQRGEAEHGNSGSYSGSAAGRPASSPSYSSPMQSTSMSSSHASAPSGGGSSGGAGRH